MHRSNVRSPRVWFLLALVVGGSALVATGVVPPPRALHATTGQNPLAPIPGKLEDLLERALEQNPEILVQEAKLTEAQAALNQARLAVTQQVVELYFQRREQRSLIDEYAKDLDRVGQLHRAGSISDGEVRQASIALAQAEGSLARTEANLRYAIGSGGAVSRASVPPVGREVVSEEDRPEPRLAIPAQVADLLDQVEITAEFSDQGIGEVADFIGQLSGISILLSPDIDPDQTVTLRLRGSVTLRQAMHAISDLTELHFVVRDYGFLISDAHAVPDRVPVVPPLLWE